MLYRKKKIKKFKEGFIKRVDQKLVLYDEKKCKVESMFTASKLEEGLELEFDENYCEVGGKENLVDARVSPVVLPGLNLNRKPPVKRMGLNRSSGLKVTMKKKIEHEAISSKENNTDLEVRQPPKQQQQPRPVARKRLQLDDLKDVDQNSERLSNYCINLGDNTPKSDKELLDLFMSDNHAVDGDFVDKEEEVEQVEQPKIIQNHSPPIQNPSSCSTIPNFKDFEGNSSSEDDYEEARPVAPKPIAINTPTVTTQKRFTQVSKDSVLHPSKKFKAPVTKSRILTTRPNKFNFCFQLPPSDQGNKLLREISIPNIFKDINHYKSCLSDCLTEVINLELQSLRLKFEKVLQKSKSNLDSAMRAHRIPFYSGVCLSESQSLDFGMGNRSNNVSLTIDNKEHHSQYSKDDIWIVSDKADMLDCEYFRSFYYGPSGSSLEVNFGIYKKLTSLSKNPNSLKPWMNRNDLFAVRAVNAHGELMMLDMIENDLQDSKLVNDLVGKGHTKRNGLLNMESGDEFKSLYKDCIKEFGLNEDQAAVIIGFCNSLYGDGNPIALVHGVYGAGKSFVIAVLIIILAKAASNGYFKEDIKIAFASMTNVAVDRILMSLQELGFEDFVRVGSLKKIAKSILPFTAQAKNNDTKELNDMLRDDLSSEDLGYVERAIKEFQSIQAAEKLHNAFVIGITCLATNFEILNDIKCPIFILDECSQMTEPMALLPIVRFQSEYGLLVGDPKQLAPTLSTGFRESSNEFGLERTLFERLAHGGYKPILLGIQYRCHPAISAVSNNLFYDKKLRDGISKDKNGPLVAGLPPFVFCHVEGYDDKTSSGSYINESESRLIVYVVKQMVALGIEPTEIGVISLYKGQAEFICHNLSQIGITNVQVATVDSFQGSEKKVIILSTVRSTSSVFLEEPRRVNVALTRAKHHLIVTATEKLAKSSALWNQIKSLAGRNGVLSTTNLASIFATPDT